MAARRGEQASLHLPIASRAMPIPGRADLPIASRASLHLSGNTTTNNADNGSLQSSSNSKTKMAGGNTVIATGSGTISVTASQQLHTQHHARATLQHPAAPLSGFHPVASENNNAAAVSAALGSVTAGHGHHNQHPEIFAPCHFNVPELTNTLRQNLHL